MSPPELTHKVRQLDDDVQAIYVMLADIQATQGRHSNRFQELAEILLRQEGRLDAHDVRFDRIDTRLDEHNARFDRIDTRLDGLDTRFDRADARLVGLDAKLDSVLHLLRDGR